MRRTSPDDHGGLPVVHDNVPTIEVDDPRLLDLLLAVAEELAELFEFALRGVRLALGAAARKLLARALDLNRHLSELADELAARLLHFTETLAPARQAVFEALGDRLLVAQYFLIFGEAVREFAKLGV